MLNHQDKMALNKLHKKDAFWVMGDSLNLIAIFSTFLTQVGRDFLENVGRNFMFPIAAGITIVRAIFAWREYQIKKGKQGSQTRMIVEVATALAVTTAVVGGFFWSALISPIIFTATLGLKSLYHLGAACYYWGKSAVTRDSQKKQAYRAAMYANFVGFTAGALSTVAVGCIMLAGVFNFAVMGVTACVIGLIYAGVNYKKLREFSSRPLLEEPLITQTDSPRPPTSSPQILLKRAEKLEEEKRELLTINQEKEKQIEGLTVSNQEKIKQVKELTSELKETRAVAIKSNKLLHKKETELNKTKAALISLLGVHSVPSSNDEKLSSPASGDEKISDIVEASKKIR